jgi:tetratricopeptide (TPR) repeat protein
MPDPSLADPGRTVLPTSQPAASTDARTSVAPTLGSTAAYAASTDSPEPLLPQIPGYEVQREIARGGMGRILAAHDLTLDREVAIKVLLPGHSAEDAERRFLREAKITARLPHPAIPPVYALGVLSEGGPFLAMKLIRGQTLAALLKEAPSQRVLPLLVQVFEQVAQAVGFAHARGIVHRDLKPANVMVGEFGEVQVMDWGLAKLITNDEAPGSETDVNAVDHDETLAGSVLGTPAYMPPEQARGEQVDARADVFALGGILCAILTGRAPFVGTSAAEVMQRTAKGDLADALTRLDACGADVELVTLAKRCLSSNAADRPADGKAVAVEVDAYGAGVEKRLRKAEMERAAAEAEAREQRKRRKVQLALAAAVGLLLTGSTAVAVWHADRKATEARLEGERDTEQRLKAEQAQQGVQQSLALAPILRRQCRFNEAAALLVQAAELARSGAPELLAEVEQAQRDLAFVVELDEIRVRKWLWIVEEGAKGGLNTHVAPSEYRKAFADRGLDLTLLKPAEAASRIAASRVKTELTAAVDDWALYEPDDDLRIRLLEIARRADPDPWRDRLRDPAVRSDRDEVARLAADADPATTPSTALSTLAELLRRHRLDRSSYLAAARAKRPADFELAFAEGWLHQDSSRGLQIGPYEAARAIRPDNPVVWAILALALKNAGDLDGAIAAYEEAVRLNPKAVRAHYNLGIALRDKGDLERAIGCYREAIRLDPTLAVAHIALGNALRVQGELNSAIAAYQEAVRVDSHNFLAHVNLGSAFCVTKKWDAAVAAYEEAIRLEPNSAPAHTGLGNARKAKGDLDAAIGAYRSAVRLDPQYALAYTGLGLALREKHDWEGAIAAFRTAIQLDPQQSALHNSLGLTLAVTGDVNRAMASFREAIRLDPQHASAHNGLARLLAIGPDEVRDGKQAIELARKACQLSQWKEPLYLDTLAAAYAEIGDFDKAIAHQKKALEDTEYEKRYGAEGRKRLELYSQKTPYRDSALHSAPADDEAP